MFPIAMALSFELLLSAPIASEPVLLAVDFLPNARLSAPPALLLAPSAIAYSFDALALSPRAMLIIS